MLVCVNQAKTIHIQVDDNFIHILKSMLAWRIFKKEATLSTMKTSFWLSHVLIIWVCVCLENENKFFMIK